MKLKVAIFHDWLNGFRGGERILKAFCEMFPEAPIYTLFYKPGTVDPFVENRSIYSCAFNEWNLVQKYYRELFPLYPALLQTIKLRDQYDLIISSSHCVIKGLTHPYQTKHFCYLHSPMRYMYDQFDAYFPSPYSLKRNVALALRPFFQLWDRSSNEQIDLMVANSRFVAKRVQEYYHQKVDVVYPFVELDDFAFLKEKTIKKENFFLMVTAFAPNKRVDLAIKAFNQLKLPLYIVGGGQEEESLKKLAKENITFLGNLEREKIINLFSKANAFIFPGVEDFGITPLESLAAKTAVIAYEEGGVLETLNPLVAKFFHGPTDDELVEGLIQAVRSFNLQDYSPLDLINQAEKFSKNQFVLNIKNELKKIQNW